MVDRSRADPDDSRGFVRQAFVTGVAVTLPLVVTLVVLRVVIDFLARQLSFLVGLVTSALGIQPASAVTFQIAAAVGLVVATFVLGAVVERQPGTTGIGAFFETLVSRIPGVGSLYTSVDEMTSILLDSDTDSFQEVKLVEFPIEGCYAIGFLTAETPTIVEDATDREDMVTVFLPMGPNPVMGGYVIHVSPERVSDIDMTVEEGIQSIVTSGVVTGTDTQDELSQDVLERLDRRLRASDVVTDLENIEQYAVDASAQLEETARDAVESAASRAERATDPEDGDGDGDGDTEKRDA